jgi:hypothetical protein
MAPPAQQTGSNKDFYAQQFNNMLRQSQGMQKSAIASGIRAQLENDASRAASQQAPKPTDWSWAFGGKGLPQVRVNPGLPGRNSGTVATTGPNGQPIDPSTGMAVGAPANPYSLNSWITPGKTTNAEIIRNAVNAGLAKPDKNYPIPYDHPDLMSTSWSNFTNPQDLIKAATGSGASQGWSNILSASINNMFSNPNGVATPEGGGATPPPGYASPSGA